jgi:hypothetical protein
VQERKGKKIDRMKIGEEKMNKKAAVALSYLVRGDVANLILLLEKLVRFPNHIIPA